MTSQESNTCSVHRIWIRHLFRVVLLGLILGQGPIDRVCGAEETADPYDVLYDVLMTRFGPDGEAYGTHESSPSIFNGSNFPFDDMTFDKIDVALDSFGALPQEKIEAYSDIQRALMQRHLWHLFDATLPMSWLTTGPNRKLVKVTRAKSHTDRREALRPKIASLIQRLALTKAQILALPDTRATTLKSGGFARKHDPRDSLKPFLPADVYAKEGSWVCIGYENESPAPDHSDKLKFRSAFLTFMRLPGGRSETLRYMETKTKERGNVGQFPVGTQFAFIEQAFLISDQGDMILSPLIVSISLRAYLDVTHGFHRTRPPTQSLAEFVMQPRQLMQGNAIMKALGERDVRFAAGDAGITGGVVEPFERREKLLTGRRRDMLRLPRLKLCMKCHAGRGVEGVAAGGGLFTVKETSPEEIVKATLSQKRDHDTWKALSELWHADRKTKTTARADFEVDQPRPARGKKTAVRKSSNAADPYSVLYDVIMTRYGPDGKPNGANESSPSIFKESEFPFDNRTFDRLNAAVDAFGALTQKKIEAYSDMQRALMQRHLWHVFDATIPFRWVGTQNIWSRSHPDRRDALRPKLASLIRRLALTKAEILALPDTRAVTVKSGGFSPRHDPEDALTPFLPADLYSRESSWVGIGFDADPPAPFHQNKLKFRSAFLTFMRLPEGRVETLEYVNKSSRQTGDSKQFPVGTQFALIEQAFLISDEGEMVLSPLTVSISLRTYLDVERTAPKLGRNPTQSVAEFVMQPRQLMQGKAVMKALGRRDVRFNAGDVDIHNDAVEPFEDVPHVFYREDKNDMLRRPRLTLCMSCHKSRGRRSVRGGYISDLKKSSPDEVVKATLKYKRDHETWKTLRKLWQVDSARDETQTDPQLEQSLPPKNESPKSTACGANTGRQRQMAPCSDQFDSAERRSHIALTPASVYNLEPAHRRRTVHAANHQQRNPAVRWPYAAAADAGGGADAGRAFASTAAAGEGSFAAPAGFR